jgi:glycosyltransferase involved in cell wall biosynthesis
MAGLSHGKAIVTTTGPLSEPFWSETGALALAPVGDVKRFVELLQHLRTNEEARACLGRAAAAIYRQRFDVSLVVAKIRETAPVRDLACVS